MAENNNHSEKRYDPYTLLNIKIRKKLIECERNPDSVSLRVTDEIWKDVQKELSNYDEELRQRCEKMVSTQLTDFINKQAERIFKDEAEKYPKGYTYELKEGTVIPTEILNRALVYYISPSNDELEDRKMHPEMLKDYINELYFKSIGMSSKKEKEIVTKIFRDNRTNEELGIVDCYLEAKGMSVCDRLSQEMPVFLHIDLEKAMGTQNFRFINIDNSLYSVGKYLTDVFENSKVKAWTEDISEINPDELREHFDTALVELVYSQGYDLKDFTRIYLGKKKTNDKFINDLVTALHQYPELSYINICTTVTARDFNIIQSPDLPYHSVTFPEETRIELKDDKDNIVLLELGKSFTMCGAMITQEEFVEVSDDNPLWKGAAKVYGNTYPLSDTKKFEDDAYKAVKYLHNLQNRQKNKTNDGKGV